MRWSIPFFLLLLVLPQRAQAQVTIPSRCGALGSVRLVISNKQLGAIPNAVSRVNYASTLMIGSHGPSIAGYTSVFWGGISKWFTSTDHRWRYRADVGTTGGTFLKTIRLDSPKGSFQCTLLD